MGRLELERLETNSLKKHVQFFVVRRRRPSFLLQSLDEGLRYDYIKGLMNEGTYPVTKIGCRRHPPTDKLGAWRLPTP